MFAPRWPTPLSTLLRHSNRSQPSSPFPSFTRSLCSTTTRTSTPSSRLFLHRYRLALALSLPTAALGLSAFDSRKPLECASDRSSYAASVPSFEETAGAGAAEQPKEAESMLNLRDLGFGTVAGISVGIFVKKGLKAVAFMFGGAFIFLQYLSSRSLISVNWPSISSSYDSFITKRAGPPAAQGGNRLAGLWSWFIDFVGANIQQRATFVAGIALGFRLG